MLCVGVWGGASACGKMICGRWPRFFGGEGAGKQDVRCTTAIVRTYVLEYRYFSITGGSGILTPLVIKLYRKYGDMSQISATPRMVCD